MLMLLRNVFRRSQSLRRRFSDEARPRMPELPRIDSLVEGCDYEHWLVVLRPPDGCPDREEISHHCVATLAEALGSEKAARESIYAVSTKYYYGFSCRVGREAAHRIESLPGVKWVLPDCYLGGEESGYGGEPFVDGRLCSYDDKYHADWRRR